MDQFSWIKDYKNNENIETLTDIIPDLFKQYYMIHWKIGIIDNFYIKHSSFHNMLALLL